MQTPLQQSPDLRQPYEPLGAQTQVPLLQTLLQHGVLGLHRLPVGIQNCPASVLFANPNAASAMPARPRLNFFNAARRVTDWARLLVSSSNLLFMLFPFAFWLFCF